MFSISNLLDRITEESYKAQKQRTGEILVEVHSQQQAQKLLKQTRTADLDIKVTLHCSPNSSQGVILEPELANETEADLLEGLKSQGVTAVRFKAKRKDDKIVPTRHILTLDRSVLPDHINALSERRPRTLALF